MIQNAFVLHDSLSQPAWNAVLGFLILLGAFVARINSFMVELCTNSFFLQGMADTAMLPSFLVIRTGCLGGTALTMVGSVA